MVQRDSISAWVTVDGIPLPEYDVKWNEANDKVTCWIPSETGKEYQVCLKHKNAIHHTSTGFYIDGTLAACLILSPHSLGLPNTVSCTSVKTSPTIQRTLSFASLKVSDDDSLLGNSVADIGEIRIEHWHVTAVEMTPKSVVSSSFKEVHTIHEKLKKATVTHRTGLGAENIVPEVKGCRCVNVVPLLTVIFRYRPFDVLQADGIVPAPPLPAFDPWKCNKRSAKDEDVFDISSDESDDDMHIAKLMTELSRALTHRSRRKKKAKLEHETY